MEKIVIKRSDMNIRNPHAKSLELRQFQRRIEPDKKKYNRNRDRQIEE